MNNSIMDVDTIFNKIKELGSKNSRRDELREYCKLMIDSIAKYLPLRMLNSDGADLIDCLLNGLPDNPTMNNKVKVVDIILQTMRKESTSLKHCGDIISRLCLELMRLPPDELVRCCDDSVQSIVEDSDVNMIWRDVLPECLIALSTHDTVKHCGTDMNTVEYKTQCVRALCQCSWKEKQLVQLTAMCIDMHLPRNDHKQVVNKICSYVVGLPPDTLPPLVHQLLKLCKTNHVEIVLTHLSHYFDVRLYSKLEPPPPNSESTVCDSDDIVPHSPAELSRCLSTCIYHISQGAADPELIRRHLRAWPKTLLLRAPFLLDLALALSAKGADFRSVCLDMIKSAISQRVVDDLRSKESLCARLVLPADVDVASVLKVLTTESANHRELTVIGLINLAFSLLAVPRARPAAPACWSHGKLILVRLCKAQPETAPHVLSQLADRLASHTALPQYTECLHVLCSLSPVSLERCTQLSAILENCQPTPTDYKSSAAVLDAVYPLINFSTRTRDTLVMVCRKGLYSRDSMHRCLALSGFLTVLRHVKLSRAFSSSQSVCSEQHSAHSYLTQLTVDFHATHQGNQIQIAYNEQYMTHSYLTQLTVVNFHATYTPNQVTSRVRNEAVCMEVVSILRRCLVQDAAVKQLLYTKIYDCAKEKQPLHETILEMLYEHLRKYLPESSGGSELLLDACVQVTATGAILVEPISHLLYAVAQFLQPAETDDLEDILESQSPDTGSAYLKSKLGSLLEQLCASERLARIDMEGPGLTDLTPESKAKNLKVQQALQCHDALIAHQVTQWSRNSDGVADAVYKLFKAGSQLLDQTKTQPKIGKKGSKSTLNDTRETVRSQKTQKSQTDKGKGPIKASNLVKDRAGPFKPLPCIWDLRMCLRVVELLYSEEVQWCSVTQRNMLRSKCDFHHYALRCTHSSLAERGAARAARAPAADIAAVLYHRCVCRFQAMCDFDEQTALGCLEVFRECLSLLFSANYSSKMATFLSTITGLTEGASASVAAILCHLHTALTQLEPEGASVAGAMTKKLVTALTQTTALLLEITAPPSDETSAVIIKLADYIRTSQHDCLPLVAPLLTAESRELRQAKLLEDLLLKLDTALGRLDGEEISEDSETTPMFPTIDSRSGHVLLGHICAHLNVRYRCTEHLMLRARDLSAALTTAVHGNQRRDKERIEKELKKLYKSIVAQLAHLTTWTSRCATLRCCVGGGSDKVLAACVRLYGLLATLAKQLDPALARLVCFEGLLRHCGKKLSNITDNLITYLEASQQQQSAHKVLRDTKLIPRLVLEAEQFSKHVILLGNKAQLNFQHHLSLGTARDFRIKGLVLKEALQTGEATPRGERGDEEEDDVVCINDAETDILSPKRSPGSGSEAGASSDGEAPRGKRRRLS